jgi:hypothetical protein
MDSRFWGMFDLSSRDRTTPFTSFTPPSALSRSTGSCIDPKQVTCFYRASTRTGENLQQVSPSNGFNICLRDSDEVSG